MKAAVYAGTRNVYGDMTPAAKSLLSTTHVDRVFFLIEDDAFPEPLPDIIQTLNVSKQTWLSPDGPNFNCPWTYMVLLRTAYTKIFPDLDRIVNLDIDTIVRRDISALWEIGMDGWYLAGVPETKKSIGGVTYINFGVCVMNLAMLRDGTDDKAIKTIDTQRAFANEQDVFNALCQGRIRRLPSEYNACAYTAPCGDPRVIHFAGIGEMFPWSRKRWQDSPILEPYRRMTWEEALCRY